MHNTDLINPGRDQQPDSKKAAKKKKTARLANVRSEKKPKAVVSHKTIRKKKTAKEPKKQAKKHIPVSAKSDVATPGQSQPAVLSKRVLFFCLAGFILIVLTGLVVQASYFNTDKYYLKAAAGAVEIWKGTFSPGGQKRILIMPGVQIPQKIKAVYTKKEIYPLAFNFYVSKADALMEVPGMPDFVGIKSYLNRALSFATDEEQRQTAEARINQIDRMILFYKADVAATKGSRAGLEAALDYLEQAAKLNPDDIETELIKKKKASIRELLKTL